MGLNRWRGCAPWYFLAGGPLFGSYGMIMVKRLRGEPARVGNLFDGFKIHGDVHRVLGSDGGHHAGLIPALE